MKVKRYAQKRNCRYFHPHAHYVVKLKKSWKEDLINLCHGLEKLINISSPWNEYLVAASQDYKIYVPILRSIAVEISVINLTKVIELTRIIVSVCGH